MSAAPNLLQALKDAGGLREYVVVALGTNGGFGPEVLDSVRAVIGPERKLVLVTAFADRGWTPGVNQTLVGYAQNDPQTAIADWSSAIAGHTNLLAGDNVHPGAAGGRIFAATVVDALDSLYTIPPELVDRLIPSDVPGTELVLR
jgi:lysophospholipase L1-like esterase